MSRILILPKDAETKLKIMHAVKQPLDSLTVETICRKAGISKQTFYRHFGTKFSIPIWFTNWLESITLDEIGRSLTFREALEEYFTTIRSEKDFFANSATNVYDSSEWRQKLPKRRATIEETLVEFKKIEITDELLFCIDAYTVIEAYYAAQHFSEGMIKDPILLAHHIEQCVPQILYRAMLLE
jgi:AcrR family transcriptional regulator